MVLLAISLTQVGFGGEPPKNDELRTHLSKLGYYAIPLELNRSRSEKYLAVKTRLSGEKATLLIDTGTIWTTIDTYPARKWKTPDEMGVSLVDSAFGPLTNFPTKARLVIMPELRLVEALFVNQPVLVKHLKSELWSPEGFLGCDFLMRNHCILDCDLRTLYVRQEPPNEEKRSALRQTLKVSGFGRVPLRFLRGAGLTCELNISNSIVSMVLASASPATVLDSTVAKACGLSYMKNIPFFWRFRESEGPETKVFQLNPFTYRIGDWNITDLAFCAGDLSAYDLGPKRKSPGKVDGSIGLTYLDYKRAVIDFGAGEMWVLPRVPIRNP